MNLTFGQIGPKLEVWLIKLGGVLVELCVKSLKEGHNRGFDLSLREFSSSLARCVSEPILKVG